MTACIAPSPGEFQRLDRQLAKLLTRYGTPIVQPHGEPDDEPGLDRGAPQ